MDATKKKAVAEAERWRRVVVSQPNPAWKLAKPDILEKIKISTYKESKFYTATASTTISR
tara:strand:- start:29 stop:208 length:180 start_codon:yes stop_codon:yes gene_type:complete